MTDTARTGRRAPLLLRSPDDLVSAIPYVTGFHPSDSLVVVGLGGTDGTFAARFDLPPPGSAAGAGEARALVAHIADLLAHHHVPGAALVGYGPGDRVTPLVEHAREALAGRGIRLAEALRVEAGRYWSYLCRSPRCCPPEGRTFDVTTSRVAAEATLAGCVALPGRAEVERSVAAVTGAERAAMRAATAAAERRYLAWLGEEGDTAAVTERLAEEGTATIRALVQRVRAGDPSVRDDEAAWVGILLTDLRVRDEAWVSIDDDHLDAHVALWRSVTCRVEDAYVPAPACLLAVAAWLAGQGALANVALERARRADRHYSMAAILREGMLSGLSPDALRRAMSPGRFTAGHT